MTAMFFWLIVGHCLADYPLQGAFLASAKRRTHEGTTPWQIALTAHAMIHAGCVAAVTGSILLGMAEFVAHCLIDYAKCEGWLGGRHYRNELWVVPAVERSAFWLDQVLHVFCKWMWVLATNV